MHGIECCIIHLLKKKKKKKKKKKNLGAHARSEGYCSCLVCLCVCVCVSVRSFLLPRASRPRNIYTYVFTATREKLL